MLDEPTFDTAVQPGLILLRQPDHIIDETPHYHVYLPLLVAADKALESPRTAPVERMLFERALSTAWSTLAVMAPNTLWLLKEERCRQLIQAVVQHWATFLAEGKRYSNGRTTGDTLWNAPSSLRFALARIGAPKELLMNPLPPGGVPELVQHLKLLD